MPKDDWTEAFNGEKRYRRQIQPERVDYLDEPDEFGLVPPQPARPNDPEAIQQNQRRLKDETDRAVANFRAAQQARVGPNRPKKDPGLVPWSERDVARAFNGRTAWMRHPIDDKTNEVQIWPLGQKALHFFGTSSYLSAVGIQPADPTVKGHQFQPAQEMFRLADWFKGHDYAVEKTEVIDGSTCVVLKGSLNGVFPPSLLAGDLADRIWLDRDHGWAVREREQSKADQPSIRWENSGFREIEPGLWLPTVVSAGEIRRGCARRMSGRAGAYGGSPREAHESQPCPRWTLRHGSDEGGRHRRPEGKVCQGWGAPVRDQLCGSATWELSRPRLARVILPQAVPS